MTPKVKFTFKDKQYPIALDYWSASSVLPEKFNIHILEIFTNEEKMLSTMQRIALDDLLCLELMYFYMEGTHLEWEEFLKLADEPEVRAFREDFWRAVEAFSGPLKKGILSQIWSQFKKEMKNVDLAQLTSTVSPSDFNQEESTSGQEP